VRTCAQAEQERAHAEHERAQAEQKRAQAEQERLREVVAALKVAGAVIQQKADLAARDHAEIAERQQLELTECCKQRDVFGGELRCVRSYGTWHALLLLTGARPAACLLH
jgi:hypothetical protein